ncbi:MAG: site-specific DNA-methyltransferase [Deltaproteobacteria bacterium]|nr:site-specific DNA-methyltransferase [Deltaproteobacteria bacterium]
MNPISPGDPETRSPDGVADNVARLKDLFSEAFTEGRIDFDVLRQLLGAAVDEREEKYGLNWHGKRRARQLALTPSTGTLRPCPGESVDWDTTQNLVIEGDNLEVLKLLQKSYAGKVKLIYIDPPYNTGKDFVYPDDFRDNIGNYLALTGQVDGSGRKLTSNTEASGRFHTDWLNMMYPRLKLARTLLRQDGVVFVSIDDGELASLQAIMNEVFGEENRYCVVAWQKKDTPSNDAQGVSTTHEYVVAYSRGTEFVRRLIPRSDEQLSVYKNPDNDPRGEWTRGALTRKEYVEKDYYPIRNPSGREVLPPPGTSWRVSRATLDRLIAEDRLWWGRDADGDMPFVKRFLSEVQEGVVPVSWWGYEFAGSNRNAKMEMRSLFDDQAPFDTPKPTKLIARILSIASTADDLVLDFFAGSGTTGHAVMAQNAADGGKRRFILVQLPEPTRQSGYATIADITKERLRRAGRKVRDDNPMFSGDLGFRVFKLASSNIRAWEPDRAREDVVRTLEDSIDHLKSDRTEQDILYELLLKLGVDLCVPIVTRSIGGMDVHAVGGGVLMACLATRIGREDVEALALGVVAWHRELAPAGEVCCVFRDAAFADDVAKTNLAAILDQHGLKTVRSL